LVLNYLKEKQCTRLITDMANIDVQKANKTVLINKANSTSIQPLIAPAHIS
jgi:hypothetical protein